MNSCCKVRCCSVDSCKCCSAVVKLSSATDCCSCNSASTMAADSRCSAKACNFSASGGASAASSRCKRSICCVIRARLRSALLRFACATCKRCSKPESSPRNWLACSCASRSASSKAGKPSCARSSISWFCAKRMAACSCNSVHRTRSSSACT